MKDTPIEKKQHEETGRHQGQLKRFLRNIQNDHEKAEREKQKAKAEVDRLNKVVGGTASVSSTTVAPFKTAAAPKTQASAADRKKQIQQLVDMGVAVPDEYRADMALAGDWKTVSQRNIEEPVIDDSLNKGVRKRKFEGQEEEEEAGEVVMRRGWGSTTKRYPGEAIDELDSLLSMNPLKKKEDEKILKKEHVPPATIDEPAPKPAENTDSDLGSLEDNPIKSEDADPAKLNLSDTPKEPSAPIFKKRKQKVPAV